MRHIFIMLFLILVISVNVPAQKDRNDIPGPIEKIKTPNGSSATRVPVIHGYLMDVKEATVRILVNDGSGVGLEIGFPDIEVAYKLYNHNDRNHHKSGFFSGAAVGAGVTIYKIKKEEKLNDLEVPISMVIGWGFGYWMSKRIDDNKEIPFRIPFYNAAEDNIDKLSESLRELKKDSELKFILKQ